jgi:hypothetical protein
MSLVGPAASALRARILADKQLTYVSNTSLMKRSAKYTLENVCPSPFLSMTRHPMQLSCPSIRMGNGIARFRNLMLCEWLSYYVECFRKTI